MEYILFVRPFISKSSPSDFSFSLIGFIKSAIYASLLTFVSLSFRAILVYMSRLVYFSDMSSNSTIIIMITRISSANVSNRLRKLSLSTADCLAYRVETFTIPPTSFAVSLPHVDSISSIDIAPRRHRRPNMTAITIFLSGLTRSHNAHAVSRLCMRGCMPYRSRE